MKVTIVDLLANRVFYKLTEDEKEWIYRDMHLARFQAAMDFCNIHTLKKADYLRFLYITRGMPNSRMLVLPVVMAGFCAEKLKKSLEMAMQWRKQKLRDIFMELTKISLSVHSFPYEFIYCDFYYERVIAEAIQKYKNFPKAHFSRREVIHFIVTNIGELDHYYCSRRYH